MSPTTIEPGDIIPFAEPRPQLELLLIYEDAATGLRGKFALDHILSQPEVGADVQLHAWGLTMLGYPECQVEAARDALGADIIALSIHGHKRLAPATEQCLRRWLAHPRSWPCALVISLDADTGWRGELNPHLSPLCSTATHHGMTVFFQHGEAPHPEMNAALAKIQSRTGAGSLVPEQIPNQADSYRRWGLNE